jgi:A/G-specific adenine glycosylase
MPDRIMRVETMPLVTNKILAYYDANARILPWRSPPGGSRPDPYHVWLSEVMLQQTTVAAVKAYFATFTQRWPTCADLAHAEDADVMAAWAGLGYYARARNLLACARQVTQGLGGQFPETEEGLRALPGIGPYTAAAISAIAFGRRAVVVDGNVERVIARLFAVKTALPAAKAEIYGWMDSLTPQARAGDFAQAMMDLGATICTPRRPLCHLCPMADDCRGRAEAEAYPVKAAKQPKPERQGRVWWIEVEGHVALTRRPAKGLLGGMRALPSCDWVGDDAPPPFTEDWQALGAVTHVFTHFRLTLQILGLQISKQPTFVFDVEWWPIDRLHEAGLPTLFNKAAMVARQG